jgi:hypothetical protein
VTAAVAGASSCSYSWNNTPPDDWVMNISFSPSSPSARRRPMPRAHRPAASSALALERDVVQAGAALAQELGDEAVVAYGLEDLPLHLAFGARHVQHDAREARSLLKRPASSSEDLGEERQLVVDLPHGHADVNR